MIYLSKKKKKKKGSPQMIVYIHFLRTRLLYDQGIYILIGMIIGLHFFTPVYYMIMNQNFDMTDRLSCLHFILHISVIWSWI